MDAAIARIIWQNVETLNAVTYFSPECVEAPAGLGLKGFWMGYFAFRAAPMGPVAPAVVEATFFNFHPARVRRALPDAWTYASPTRVLETRAKAAAAALRRLLPDGAAERLGADALPSLTSAIGGANGSGRPLFAANRDVVGSDDIVAALWQAATTLREHRGDGHVALLTSAGLDGCEVHVLLAAAEGLEPALFLASRGWSEADWQAATERVHRRGFLGVDGTLTSAGRELRRDVERRTDELAIEPYEPLGDDGIASLLHVLEPAARRVAADITYPNPMGLAKVR